MPTALLLVHIEIGKENEVMTLLKNTKGAEDIYLVFGAYDIVAKIRTETIDELQEIVNNRLLKSKEIRSTTAMIIIPEKPKVVVLSQKTAKILA